MLLAIVGVDLAGRGIDGEQHGALEAVMLGENLSELRQGLFGAVLFVAADENDVLSFAGTFGAFVHDIGVGGVGCGCEQQQRSGSSECNEAEADAVAVDHVWDGLVGVEWLGQLGRF